MDSVAFKLLWFYNSVYVFNKTYVIQKLDNLAFQKKYLNLYLK